MKACLYFLAGLLVLSGAGLGALRFYFPPDKVKARIISGTRDVLHRQLEIQRLRYGPWTGLRVDGVRLSERGDFSNGEFASAESITLSPSWRRLLEGKLVIGQASVVGLRGFLRRDINGTFNIEDLLTSTAPANGAASVGTPTFPVDSFSVTNGAIIYVDVPGDARIEAARLSLSLDSFTLTRPSPVSLEFDADYAQGKIRLNGPLKARGALDLGSLHASKMVIAFSDLSAVLNGIALKGWLNFSDFKALKVHTKFAAPDFQLSELATFVPKLKNAKPSIRGALTFAATLSGGRLDLYPLELKSEGIDAAANGSLSKIGGDALVWDMKLRTNAFALDSLAKEDPAAAAYGLTGTAGLDMAIQGTVSTPTLSGQLDLEGIGGRFRGQKLEETSGRLRFFQDSLEGPLSGRFNGSDFKLKLSASDLKAPALKVDGWIATLDLGLLMSTSTPRAPLQQDATTAAQAPYSGPAWTISGDFRADKVTHPNFKSEKLSVSWDFTGVTPSLERIGGALRLSCGSGHLINLLGSSKPRTGLIRAIFLPLEILNQIVLQHIPGLAMPDLKNIAFTRINGDYFFKKGIVTFRPSKLEGKDMSWSSAGTLNLPAKTADLRSTITLGVVALDETISGPFDHLSAHTNVAKTVGKEGLHILALPAEILLSPFAR